MAIGPLRRFRKLDRNQRIHPALDAAVYMCRTVVIDTSIITAVIAAPVFARDQVRARGPDARMMLLHFKNARPLIVTLQNKPRPRFGTRELECQELRRLAHGITCSASPFEGGGAGDCLPHRCPDLNVRRHPALPARRLKSRVLLKMRRRGRFPPPSR